MDDPEPDIVHKLRNEIGVIIGFCDLVLETLPPDDVRRGDLQQIREAAQNALSLIPAINRLLQGT